MGPFGAALTVVVAIGVAIVTSGWLRLQLDPVACGVAVVALGVLAEGPLGASDAVRLRPG